MVFASLTPPSFFFFLLFYISKREKEVFLGYGICPLDRYILEMFSMVLGLPPFSLLLS